MLRQSLLITALAAALAAAAAPPASAAPPSDACTLLDAAAVGAVMGMRMDRGTHVGGPSMGTCTWNQLGRTGPGGGSVVVGFKSVQIFSFGKAVTERYRRALRGLGDEAYFAGMGRSHRRPILNVRKGRVAFNVAVYGNIPAERARSLEKRLARRILTRL